MIITSTLQEWIEKTFPVIDVKKCNKCRQVENHHRGYGGTYVCTKCELAKRFVESHKLEKQIKAQKEDIQSNQARIQELQNEVATHLQALDTAQEWHESQKREITEQKDQVIQEKEQTIQQLQTNLTESQAEVNQQEQTIAQLNQTNQIQQTQLQETQELNHKLQQDNQDLLKDIHTYKQTIQSLQTQTEDQTQRILALEADKQDLINQLTQAQEIYQNYLTQEKSLICQEITLIKEVIHV